MNYFKYILISIIIFTLKTLNVFSINEKAPKKPEKFISIDATLAGFHVFKPDHPARKIDSDGIGVWAPGVFGIYTQKLKNKIKFLQDYLFVSAGIFQNTAAENQTILAIGTSNLKRINDKLYYSFGYGILHSYVNNNSQSMIDKFSIYENQNDANILVPFVLFKLGYDINKNFSTHLHIIPSYATMISVGITYKFY